MVSFSWVAAESLMLPFYRLEEYLSERYRMAFTDADIALRIGVNREMIRRYRRLGVDPFEADRLAVSLGMHPATIWPEWWTA
jgi:hypothetical protein